MRFSHYSFITNSRKLTVLCCTVRLYYAVYALQRIGFELKINEAEIHPALHAQCVLALIDISMEGFVEK